MFNKNPENYLMNYFIDFDNMEKHINKINAAPERVLSLGENLNLTRKQLKKYIQSVVTMDVYQSFSH